MTASNDIDINVSIDEVAVAFDILENIINVELTEQGPRGFGVAEGGDTGQVLKKTSDTDYDTEWKDDEAGTDEKVKYNSDDPTAGYLDTKVIAGDGVSIAEGSGADENKLVITNSDKGSDVDLSGLLVKASNLSDLANVITARTNLGLGALALLSDLSSFDTADLVEGTNLYYTTARFDTAFAGKDTGDLTEGTNLYYTSARFDTAFSSKDTDDLTDTAINRFTNDTDILRLVNTSGENTGDQVSSDFSHNSLTGINEGTDYEHITQTQKDALHNAITILDTAEIDFTLVGQQISADIKLGSIDETKLDTSVNISLGLANSALQSFIETDPIFVASQAHNIDADDITNLGNLSGINTGNQDLSGLVPYTGATADVDLGVFDLTTTGDILAKELISANSGTINRTSGVITSVEITDGRTLTPTRTSGAITSITDGTRTWTFNYTDDLISSWTLS